MNDRRPVVVIGAGGHATVVVDALLARGRKPVFILDDDPKKHGAYIGGVAVRGPLRSLSAKEFRRYGLVVGIAKNDLRRRLALDLLKHGASLYGVRHPSAIISPRAIIEPTVQILAGAIVNAGAQVGPHTVLNTGCIVEHNCKIGEYCHVGPGAILAGAVTLDRGAFVATGAKACPFARLGAWSILGAGAVALGNVCARSTVVGVPARPITRRKGAAREL